MAPVVRSITPQGVNGSKGEVGMKPAGEVFDKNGGNVALYAL